jgi:hypothetical protein
MIRTTCCSLLVITFILLTSINCKSLKILQDDTENVASAIFKTIDKFYIQGHRQFRVRIYGEITPHLSDVIDALGRRINDRTPLMIEHHLTVNKKSCIFNMSTVILTSTVETMNAINKLSKLKNRVERSLRFIVYCEEIGDFEMPQFNLLMFRKGHMVLHEYFLVNERKSILLLNNRYFTGDTCYKSQMLVVDNFDIMTRKWQNDLREAENGKQFFGCMLTTALELNTHGHYLEEGPLKTHYTIEHIVKIGVEHFTETAKLSGIFVEINEIIAKKANYTPNYQLTFDGLPLTKRGKYINNSFNYMITTLYSSYHLGQVFSNREFLMALTPSEQYTNYEKVLFPFDVTSWILFGLFFGMTLVAIAITNRLPQETQLIVYGADIKTPTYNVVGAFFGIAQMRLPRENCPRILLTFFIYLCLIFRTCYQGRMFDFMTSNMQRPAPETMEDLYNRDYTIMADTDLSDFGFVGKM